MSLTTDQQLFKLAEKYGIPLRAVVFKDQLYDIPLESGGYIINMSDSGSMGTHWICLWIEKKKVVYFDSFGISPPIEIRNAVKNLTNKILVSDKHIQNINSGWCGIYNLFFLWFMHNHKKKNIEKRLESFIDLFSDDVEKNLSILKNLFIANP